MATRKILRWKVSEKSSLVLSAVAGCMLAACASTKESPTPAPAPAAKPVAKEATAPAAKVPSAEYAALVSVTAKVEAIDHATRVVTLKGPLGNVVTFAVDERVKRLNEVQVGDEVTADYYVSLAGELRAPTEEERQNPLVKITGGARAPKGTSPAGGAVQAYRVVATITALDQASQSFTLQGPLGNSGVIHSQNPENFKQMHVGDTVVVIYTEALAVTLEKAKPAAK